MKLTADALMEALRANDDDAVEKIGHMQCMDTYILMAAANREMDLNEVAADLVAAPGVGLAGCPVAVHFFLDHGGTDIAQTAGGDHLALNYKASNEIAELGSEAQCAALIEAAADAGLYVPVAGAFVPEPSTAIALDNSGATEYALGDGTLSVRVYYRVMLMAAFS